MAETNINDVIERVKNEVLDAQATKAHGFGLRVADVAALLAELETLRTAHENALDGLATAKSELIGFKVGYGRVTKELETLRRSLKDAHLIITAGTRKPEDRDYEEYLEVRERVDRDIAALQSQPAPAPEWTPEIGSEVHITEEARSSGLEKYVGQYGVVIEFTKSVNGTTQYVVQFEQGRGFSIFALPEIEPVDE